jgi:TPR repeat protein
MYLRAHMFIESERNTPYNDNDHIELTQIQSEAGSQYCNYESVVKLLDKACKAKHTPSIQLRAEMYENGEGEKGGRPNYTQAIKLYHQLQQKYKGKVQCAAELQK